MAGAETTSATEALTTPGEKKRLSKYVSRMKTVLRRADYSKRVSSSSMAPPVVASSATPAVDTVETEPTSETAPAVTKPTIKQSNAARHLAQKYSIGLDISDWKITEVAERFEKPIRMRIHRTCHVCNTSYGTDRTCASCSHKRCKKCPRYPKKEAQGGKGKDVTCMDTNKIHATSSIEKAHEVGQRSSADVRHRKLPTPDEPLHLDEQQPLKEIPLMKRERTLQLLRIYIATLERVGHKYLDPTHYRGLPIGSEPSVTDCSSNGSIRSGASTLASVASTISRLRTSACSLEDDPEQESKSSRPLPEDLRARKALMRYIGCCAACSRRRTRCHLRHHDFQSLLNDPRLGDQARADIKWVHEQGATDAVNVQVVEDFATPLGDPLLQHSVLEGPKRIGGLLEKVDDVFRSPTMNKSQERDSDLPVNDGLVSLYPQTLDIIHDSIEKRSDRFGTQGDPTQYRPYLSLVIVQSSPGALIEFLPPEGTAEFVSAVHIYDQSDDTLQDKVARIIFNFEKWREFFCPSGRAERRLDMTPMTTIDENSIIGTSSSVSNGVEDDIGKANQRISSARSVLDEVAVSVAADGPDDFETRSIESSTGLSRYLKKEPSSSEILSAYISFAQHTGLTEAATGSSSSSGSKSASQGNNSRTPQTSQTTISSRKRGRDGDDDSTGWHEGTKRSRNSGSSDHDANEGCIFICPFFSFSLIMRYGCACSSRSFKSINSLRHHIFADHREIQCERCHEIFPKKIALAKHKERGCDEVFWCNRCLQRFPGEEECENHSCRKAVIPRCSQCLERFPSHDLRLRHEQDGCTTTPLPEFRIVDDILYEKIKKSLEKKDWTFANEQDEAKKSWINNNVGKFCGELSHKQRELIKWIALWESFSFAKSIPDSPFRDMTIPTSDVQINEIMRKVKEDLRLKLIGDDHPLSTDSRKQEEQTAWLLDSLLGTLGQFANLPTRPTTRRFRRNSRGIPSTNGMPMTSSPAMVEQINHMMSDTASGTDAPESAQPNGQGFAAANFQHQLMQPPPLAPSQMTFNSLPTAQLPILNRSRLSDQNLPISHGHVHYQRQNRTQQSFLDHQQLLLQQQFLSEQLFPSSAALGEPSTTPFALISYPGINKYTSAKMSTSQQPTYDQQQQMYGQQENFGQQQNFNQHQDQVQPHMRESEFSRAADLLCSPPIPNSLHETLDASSATGLLPQSNQTIDPNLLSAIDPYFAFVGSQYFSAANPTPPDP